MEDGELIVDTEGRMTMTIMIMTMMIVPCSVLVYCMSHMCHTSAADRPGQAEEKRGFALLGHVRPFPGSGAWKVEPP